MHKTPLTTLAWALSAATGLLVGVAFSQSAVSAREECEKQVCDTGWWSCRPTDVNYGCKETEVGGVHACESVKCQGIIPD